MDGTLEALGIFLVLLPGFLSSTILDHIVVRKGKDHLGRIIEALVFSFLIYATLVSLALIDFRAIPIPQGTNEISETARLTLNPTFVLGVLGLAVLYPLLLGLLLTTDLHMKILRWARVSNKTSRETTWLDVFSEQKRYVIVNLSGRRRIFGWPLYYSNDRDEGLLYLYDPAWVNEDGTYTDLDIHGLFLVEADAIESIEFTHVEKGNARPAALVGRNNGTDHGNATG